MNEWWWLWMQKQRCCSCELFSHLDFLFEKARKHGFKNMHACHKKHMQLALISLLKLCTFWSSIQGLTGNKRVMTRIMFWERWKKGQLEEFSSRCTWSIWTDLSTFVLANKTVVKLKEDRVSPFALLIWNLSTAQWDLLLEKHEN